MTNFKKDVLAKGFKSSESSRFEILFTSQEVKVINTETNGCLTFNLQGEDIIIGIHNEDTVFSGGKITRKIENVDRIQNVTFDLSCEYSELEIQVTNHYKNDIEIENDGIIGVSKGDMGFEKAVNVFVEGNPTMAGFSNESKTQFILASNYGEMTPHWDIVDDILYKGIDKKKGEKTYAKLSILREELPIRMLCQPDGQNATFTIASHADRANVDVTRAVFYGTNNRKSLDYNTKGMLAYGIKGTLSVFAASERLKYNIDDLLSNMNKCAYSIFQGNFKNSTYVLLKYAFRYVQSVFEGNPKVVNDSLMNPEFKALMDVAYSQGIEIIPHTMTLYADNRAKFKRYLPVFQKNYKSRNFIDHFLFAYNESSGLHSSGNKVDSPFYVMDLVEKFGYDYAWSYQDTSGHNIIKDQIFPEHFQFPMHLLYKNKKLAFPDGEAMWQYKCTNRLLHGLVSGTDDPTKFLKELIRDGGYCTDHNYFTGSFGFLYVVEGGEFKINPRLDIFLSFLRDKKESGEIWNPTQSDLNDHMVRLMNIDLTKIGRYKYNALSKNDKPISVSFMMKGAIKAVTINGVTANAKINGDNFIFWGYLEKGENSIVLEA